MCLTYNLSLVHFYMLVKCCGFKCLHGFRPAGTQANERLIAGMREALSEQERTQKEQEDALEDRVREIETLTQGDSLPVSLL